MGKKAKVRPEREREEETERGGGRGRERERAMMMMLSERCLPCDAHCGYQRTQEEELTEEEQQAKQDAEDKAAAEEAEKKAQEEAAAAAAALASRRYSVRILELLALLCEGKMNTRCGQLLQEKFPRLGVSTQELSVRAVTNLLDVVDGMPLGLRRAGDTTKAERARRNFDPVANAAEKAAKESAAKEEAEEAAAKEAAAEEANAAAVAETEEAEWAASIEGLSEQEKQKKAKDREKEREKKAKQLQKEKDKKEKEEKKNAAAAAEGEEPEAEVLDDAYQTPSKDEAELAVRAATAYLGLFNNVHVDTLLVEPDLHTSSMLWDILREVCVLLQLQVDCTASRRITSGSTPAATGGDREATRAAQALPPLDDGFVETSLLRFIDSTCKSVLRGEGRTRSHSLRIIAYPGL